MPQGSASGRVLTSDSTGNASWQSVVLPVFDATVDFGLNIDPNSVGTTFSPNTPASTTVLYVSSINGSQWTFNGSSYITAPVLASWSKSGNAGTLQASNFIGTTDNVGLSIRTNNLVRLTVSNSGNVGIGNTTPNAPLQFSNDNNNRKIVFFQSVNNDNQFHGFGLVGSTVRYQIASVNSKHAFYAATSATTSDEIMTILGSGNVGIGTTTPLSRFQVDNTAALSSTAGASSSIARFRNNVGTNFKFLDVSVRRHTAGTDWGTTNTRIQKFVDATAMGFIDFGINGVVSDFGGLGFGSNATTNMVLNNGGNLGLGTRTPENRIHVFSAAVANTGGIRLAITSASAPQTGQPLGVDTNGDIVRIAATADWSLTGNTGTVQATNFIGTSDNVGLSIRTNNVIRASINNLGGFFVGNGHTNVGALNGAINGVLNTFTPISRTTQNIELPETALRLVKGGTSAVAYPSTVDMQIGTYAIGINALTRLNFRLGNGGVDFPDTDVMTMQGNGNVGIGTTTPNSTIQSNGSLSLPLTTFTTNATLTNAHYTANINNGATAVTVTLPTPIGVAGRIYVIKRSTGSTGTVTLNTAAGSLVSYNGSLVSSFALLSLGATSSAVEVQSDGTNWHLI